jgi:cytochrome P450 family 313
MKLKVTFGKKISSRAESLLLENSFKPWKLLDKHLKLCKSTRDLHEHRSQIFKLLRSFTAEHEAEFQGKGTEKPRKPSPYLDVNYSLRNTVTYNDFLENLMFFLIGAFDTSGKTLAFTLLLLAMNPMEQEKLQEEIKSVMVSETGEVDEERLSELVYLDLVIKETLRLIPQVLIFSREATEDVELSKLLVFELSALIIFSKLTSSPYDSKGGIRNISISSSSH